MSQSPTSPREPRGAGLGVALLGVGALGALAFALLSNTPHATPDATSATLDGQPVAKVPLAEAETSGPRAHAPGAPVAGMPSASGAETWTAAARDYELRYSDARGQEIVRLVRFDPSAQDLAGKLQGQSKWSYPLALSEAQLPGQSHLARDLRLLIDQVAQEGLDGKPRQRIALPDGGWIEAKRRLKELPARTRGGFDCRGATTQADLRGKTRSGERFEGKLEAELWLEAQGGALVALRVKQTLDFADHGRRAVSFSLRPLAKDDERRVGARPSANTEPQVASLSGDYPSSSAASATPLELGSELVPTLALLGSGVLILFFGTILLRWLGPSSALCLCLSLAIVTTPLAVQAQDKTSFGDRFSDPTENEVAYSVLAGVTVGLGAAFAFFTAPVWVPVAVGAAGVTAIGAYWFTRTPPIRKGTISDKRFEPDRTYLTYVPMTISDGKGGTTTIMIPKVVHDDADYVIQINQGEESSKVYVTADQFAKLEVGQTFDMDTMGGNRFDEHDSRRATAAEKARLEAAKARGEEAVPMEGINDALRGSGRD
jgi:hypothetical protein